MYFCPSFTKNFYFFFIFFFTNQKFFLASSNLHNSKTTRDRRKPIVDLESISKNGKLLDEWHVPFN